MTTDKKTKTEAKADDKEQKEEIMKEDVTKEEVKQEEVKQEEVKQEDNAEEAKKEKKETKKEKKERKNRELEKQYLDMIERTLPKSSSSLLNIIPFDPDEEPSILKLRKSARQRIAADLLSLYQDEVFEHMVETDGSFSYVLSTKYKKILEKAIFDSSDVDKNR